MFYNCHIHIFKDSDVPRKFLPFGLVRVLATKAGFNVISKTLNNLNPFSCKDILDRFARFAKIRKLGSQEVIFLECMLNYHKLLAKKNDEQE